MNADPGLFEHPTILEKPQMVVSLTILRDDYQYFEQRL